MDCIFKLEGIVTGFVVTEKQLDCMCGKELIKLDKRSGNIIFRKEAFDKEGLSRSLVASNGQLFVYDFCTLYVFEQESYELLYRKRLGTDLTFDICAIMANDAAVYCSMRNGKIIAVDRQTCAMKEVGVSGSSIWCMREYMGNLICGTVDGKLLVIDGGSLNTDRTVELGRQNIGSLCINNDTVYAAGQDKKLYKIDLADMEVDTVRRNVHKKAFKLIGVYEDMVITVSHACSEIGFWDADTLDSRKTVHVPLASSGSAYIDGGFVYIASRNVMGVRRIPVSDML